MYIQPKKKQKKQQQQQRDERRTQKNVNINKYIRKLPKGISLDQFI